MARSLKCLFLASTAKMYFLKTSLVPIAQPFIFGQRSTPGYFIRNRIQNQKIALLDCAHLSKFIIISKRATAVANGVLASDTYKFITEFCNFVGELYTYGKNFIFVFQTRNLLHFTSIRYKSEHFYFMIYLWAMHSVSRSTTFYEPFMWSCP